MKAKNKIHQAKKAKWLTLIKEQSESSLTIKQWCDLNGYTIHTFYYWKRLLKEEALQNISVPEIVPLVQPPSPVLQGESLPLNLCNSHKLHELETPSQNKMYPIKWTPVLFEISVYGHVFLSKNP